MDSGVDDPSVYDPASLYGVADDPLMQETPLFTPPSPGPISLNELTDIIPGAKSIKALLEIVSGVLGGVEGEIKAVEQHNPLTVVAALTDWMKHAGKLVLTDADKSWEWIEQFTLGNVFKSYLKLGLRLDVEQMEDEAGDAMKTVDTMLGFAFFIQFIVAAIEHVAKPILANRWAGEALVNTIAKIPEEIGLSWALGMTIDESFKAAQGVVLEEAINTQKHPNRIGWPQIRILLKQHVIDDNTYEDLMIKQGFNKEQRGYLKGLQDVQIPIGDIAQLWYRKLMTDEQALLRIERLGFTPEDALALFDMYMAKSENEATVTYRSMAKRAFTDQLLTEAQYRAVLKDAQYPERLADSDVEGIKLAQKIDLAMLEVATVKKRFQAGLVDDKAASAHLAELGYPAEYITTLLTTWGQGVIRHRHSISTAKILSYVASGVLTDEQAKPWLAASGMDDPSITFLLAHPTAHAGVHLHQLTPGLVVQAYVDGLVTDEGLPGALKAAHTEGETATYYEEVAKYRKAHQRTRIAGTLDLDKGEVERAYKAGLIEFHDMVVRLEHLGYTPEASMLLAEIANKGPYEPPRPPVFANVGAALDFLVSQGFTIYAPTDPRITIAEGMLAQAGYSWAQPADWKPQVVGGGLPVGTGGGGGGGGLGGRR